MLLTFQLNLVPFPSDPKPIWLVVLQWEAIAALDYLDICGWWCWNGK
ncbi:MAG: hypothetical protein ACYTXT_38325 [Nostoc sp.]